VRGTSNSGDGVYGRSNRGHAALLEGNAKITGNLEKAGGSFKIDHPLDPANKYLSHSFVESPDMKNVYDGTVILDNHIYAVDVIETQITSYALCTQLLYPTDSPAGSSINQYLDSQTFPYQEPHQVPTSIQTAPEASLPFEEQQLLQENGVVDVTVPETTISSVVDGNNIQLQEGAVTTSNKVVFTIESARELV
jgi:hypothetical protein